MSRIAHLKVSAAALLCILAAQDARAGQVDVGGVGPQTFSETPKSRVVQLDFKVVNTGVPNFANVFLDTPTVKITPVSGDTMYDVARARAQEAFGGFLKPTEQSIFKYFFIVLDGDTFDKDHAKVDEGVWKLSVSEPWKMGKNGPAGIATDTVTITVKDDAIPVPEPGAWMLCIAGLGMAGANLRHRRKLGRRRLSAPAAHRG